MKKKGSHVGIVLSFVIFITFLLFLYTMVEPSLRTQTDKEALLDYLKIELIERFSANLTSVTINTDKEVLQNCIILKNLIGEVEVNFNLIVKDKLGDISQAKISADENNDLFIEREEIGLVFYKIYNSEEFEELNVEVPPSCKDLFKDQFPGGYTIGLVRTEEYIFETKVIELVEEYENNYEDLRSELKIPLGSEFGFGLTYKDGTKIGIEGQNISTNIYAEEIPVQYVNAEANISLGFINIQVW